ncbi:hypothetical protein D3C72_1794720 [compost metagenome]
MAWAQGGGKQEGAAGRGDSRRDLPGRHHVTQAQGRQAALARPFSLSDIEQKMRVEQFTDTKELQGIEVELQQRRVNAGRLLIELFLNQANTVQ